MKHNFSYQSGTGFNELRDTGTQVGPSKWSYQRRKSNDGNSTRLAYDLLVSNYLFDRSYLLSWSMEFGLIASHEKCDICLEDMTLVNTVDGSNSVKWQCRRCLNGKRHKCQRSIRSGSFFDKSNMTFEEILKFTYWWGQNLTQSQIRNQFGIGLSIAVDWDMLCFEVCEIVIVGEGVPIGGSGRRVPIGGSGRRVQIDESKIGKRKYHRGHYVEAQ